MGYTYENGRLCCDNCGKSGGVRRRKCTYGWCPPPAVCPDCWKGGVRDKERRFHEERCKAPAAAYAAKERERQKLLVAGHYLRASACSTSDGVLVTFRNCDGDEREYLMHRDTYRAIPLGDAATPECFAKHGEITERL